MLNLINNVVSTFTWVYIGRKRKVIFRILKNSTFTEGTAKKCGPSSCFLCSRLPVTQKHFHTTQSTATPSGNNAMKFSAEVSGA